MNIVWKISFVLILFNFITLSCVSWFPKKQANVNKNIFVIETDYGNMRIKLFDATPKHRDNFKKLVADSFYNGTIFHRVIHGFMIQGGTSNMKKENSNHTIEAEFVDSLIHKKGALAAARQPDYLNPKKNSSGFEFYIVQGVAIQEESLALSEQNINAMRKRSLAKVVFEDSLNAELKTKFLRARSNSQQDSTAYYGNKLEEKLTDAMLGKEFKYSNYNTSYLGLILERATSVSVSNYLEQKLWSRIMEYDALFSTDSKESNFEYMPSRLIARAIDYARFGHLMLNEGNWYGNQLISKDWIQESTQENKSIPRDIYPKWFGRSDKRIYYNYHWWGHVNNDGTFNFYANGNLGQNIYIIPDKETVIVHLGNSLKYYSSDFDLWSVALQLN